MSSAEDDRENRLQAAKIKMQIARDLIKAAKIDMQVDLLTDEDRDKVNSLWESANDIWKLLTEITK